jgi:hypothetical protein
VSTKCAKPEMFNSEVSTCDYLYIQYSTTPILHYLLCVIKYSIIIILISILYICICR